ncbi:MAG: cytochrome bc complex cytochrome b subunit [Desulfatiglans sp.]|nr:cytochrome bc complex cytochrome b subunit [Desulfatiglans sp.]
MTHKLIDTIVAMFYLIFFKYLNFAETGFIRRRLMAMAGQKPVSAYNFNCSQARKAICMNKSMVLHFRPRTVDIRALKFSMTFGLGGMAFVLIILLFFTGLLLKFYYLPLPEKAYDSILHLKENVLFGSFIRNIHYWSANVLILITFLHLLRVFLTSAFHPPRAVNWIIGIALLLIVIAFNFTGYLLPWDQLSFWAVTICTGMLEYMPFVGEWLQTFTRGGGDVSASTLSIFFAGHTALLPAVLIIVLPFHFWQIRKSGGIALPLKRDNIGEYNQKVKAIPDLIIREVATALVITAFILVLSIIFDAPIGDRANPGLSPNPSKAPWYFMGFQEILLHIHPFFAVSVLPAAILILLIWLPFMKYSPESQGIWFISKTGRQAAMFSFFAAMLLSVSAIIADEYLPDFPALLPGIPVIISNGLFPLFTALLAFAFFYHSLVKRYHPKKNEKAQAIFLFFITIFITFTVTGVWFRGSSMKLLWPWL